MSVPKEKYYRLLHPRPVYVIGSGSIKNNEINFMAASWVSPITESGIVSLACDKETKTYELIEKYKQFSINITDNIDLIWNVGTISGKEVNKIEKFKIEYESGKVLDVPILKERLGYLEVRVINQIDLKDHILYLGEVVNFDAKNADIYGWKEYWRIPLHKGGKAFVFPEKKLIFK